MTFTFSIAIATPLGAQAQRRLFSRSLPARVRVDAEAHRRRPSFILGFFHAPVEGVHIFILAVTVVDYDVITTSCSCKYVAQSIHIIFIGVHIAITTRLPQIGGPGEIDIYPILFRVSLQVCHGLLHLTLLLRSFALLLLLFEETHPIASRSTRLSAIPIPIASPSTTGPRCSTTFALAAGTAGAVL